ncbi:helix-turn-helix transcriptional regulator [Streptomyces sp. NPDC006132]|uniref:helix-turn-helix domain-containing protein n=1 Tax=Streptomyces sp. NPDC006132 TaxID=3156732 RepID=UPI0033D9099B
MATNAVQPGPTSKRVAENIAHWRKARGLQQKDLSQRMAEVGRPMLPTVISKIERGDRRIDIDDLVALSLALRVGLLRLLLPATDPDERVELTDSMTLSAQDAWECLEGDKPHRKAEVDEHGDLLRYRLDSRPTWDRDPIRQMYNQVLEKSSRSSAIGNQTAEWTKEDGKWVYRTPSGFEIWREPDQEGNAD